MKKALAAIGCLFVLWAILSIFPTVAQQPQFPQNLPANTVVGRTGITAGPAQAIPISQLSSLIGSISNISGSTITPGTVANSSLANMNPGTLKCKPVGAPIGAPQDCSYPSINVTDAPYSADSTGVNDATAAIQSAINALPAAGGEIVIPCGTYKIGNGGATGLTIGSGTTSVGSTRWGVHMRGVGNATYAPSFNLPQPACARLTWNGSASGIMLQINGPLTGWGLDNIMFDCSTGFVGGTGLKVISASNGIAEHLSFNGCNGAGIWSTTQGPLSGFSGSGISNANSEHNQYRDISIVNAQNVSQAKCILLDGTAADGSSDTDFNTFINTYCTVNSTTVQQYGIYLRVADSNIFMNTSIFGPCISTCFAVVFDYQTNSTFPTANKFYSIDPTMGAGSTFVNAGGPGGSASYNSVVDLFEGNFTRYPVRLANLEMGLPRKMASDVALTAQAAAIGATSLFTTQRSGMYRVCWYLNTDTVGTAGNINLTLNWNDRVSSEFATVVSGLVVTNAPNSGLSTAQGCQTYFIPTASGLNYLTTFQGVTGAFTYDLYLTAERLD